MDIYRSLKENSFVIHDQGTVYNYIPQVRFARIGKTTKIENFVAGCKLMKAYEISTKFICIIHNYLKKFQ